MPTSVRALCALWLGASIRSAPLHLSSRRIANESLRKAPVQIPIMIVTTPSTTRLAMTASQPLSAANSGSPMNRRVGRHLTLRSFE